MKNITLSAEEDVIERARAAAQAQKKTLNYMFREWLEQVGSTPMAAQNYEAVKKSLKHISTGGKKFTRDEMNER
jgi:GrpB-like predicted nucleotidyltransferase (UPF0157 family)